MAEKTGEKGGTKKGRERTEEKGEKGKRIKGSSEVWTS